MNMISTESVFSHENDGAFMIDRDAPRMVLWMEPLLLWPKAAVNIYKVGAIKRERKRVWYEK